MKTLIAIILLLGCAFARAEPPAPTLASSDGHAQASNQRSPSVVSYADNTTGSPTTKAMEGDGKVPTDRWLVWFTGGLLVVGIAQACLFWRQLWLIRMSVADAKKAAESAEIVSKAAVVQAETSRAMLAATQRPRLHVRNVSMQDLFFMEPGQRLAGSLTVVNTGGTRAKITNSRCRVLWTQESLPMLDQDNEQGGGFVEGWITPGVPIAIDFRDDSAEKTSDGRRWDLYVTGWIDYSDELSVGRRCAFCFKYNDDAKRFRPVDDDDYHHED